MRNIKKKHLFESLLLGGENETEVDNTDMRANIQSGNTSLESYRTNYETPQFSLANI